MWSVHTYPNRIAQVSWTNPKSNKLLLEGGLNIAMQHYYYSKHRYVDNPQGIPNIRETGDTAGLDEVATRVNASAGSIFSPLESGSIYSGNLDNLDNYRLRGAASYVTGTHHAKVGWDGQFYSQIQNIYVNDPRMRLSYATPTATCYNAANPSASTCGNTSRYFPSDPFNQARR